LCKVHVIILSKECRSIFLNKESDEITIANKKGGGLSDFFGAQSLILGRAVPRVPFEVHIPFCCFSFFLSHCVVQTIYT
jgi:hypothetical protein